MSILTVTDVTHGFGARCILDNASFRLLRGEHVGLVGANGEGKSVFLNIITGKLMPDSGMVEWCNRITTGYLDQFTTLAPSKTIRDILQDAFAGMYALEREMLAIYDRMGEVEGDEMDRLLEDVGDIQETLEHSGFYNVDVKIAEMANGLGLAEIGLERQVTELSGGQRAKVLLAKLLLENPMIMILDEPTNFLDESHVAWLRQFLQNYENAFILVSHDTEFMNAVVNVIYHIEHSTLTRYVGDYQQFLEMHELKQRQLEQAYEKQQKEIDHLEVFIAKNKARAATSNMAKSRQKKLEKMDIIKLAPQAIEPKFTFTYSRTTGKAVIVADSLVLGYDEPLTRPISFVLERGQKVAIKGVNGLGKTTLLRTIIGQLSPVSGEVELDHFAEIGYFEQEAANSDNTALQEIWNDFPAMTHGEVRGALAKCGLTSDHITSQMRVLSGGENAKVRICKLMLQKFNLLVLDEPTNHLDVVAKEVLKQAIVGFRGTVLLVSHEPDFYNDIVTDVWNIEDYTTKIV